MAREVTATLKLNAIDRTAKAFGAVHGKLSRIEKQTSVINRTQMAVNRSMAAMPVGAWVGPAALAYGAGRAVTQFAKVERQLTRTGIILGATREQTMGLQNDIQKSARDYALTSDAVMDTVDAYAAAGANLSEIKTDIGTLAKAQQALDASGRDIVNTWDTARKVFGLTTKDAEKFFEIIGAGSAAGKFEAKDLAAELPSLLPVAARHGIGGIEGTERIVALLEAMRDFTGTSGEAATSVNDFLEKVTSPDVRKRFGEVGIDIAKRLKEARKNGDDLFRVMHNIIKEATNGDATRIGDFFGDKEARRTADFLLNRIEMLEEAQKRIKASAPNLLNRNNAALMEDAQSRLDRMVESAKQVGISLGGAISDYAIPVLDNLSDNLDRETSYRRGLKREEERGGNQSELYDTFYERWTKDHGTPWQGQFSREFQNDYMDAVAAYGRGEIDNPYDVFKKMGGGPERRFRNGQHRSPVDVTGQALPGGTAPVPYARPTAAQDLAEQYAIYGRGRQSIPSTIEQLYPHGFASGDKNYDDFMKAARGGADPDSLRQAIEGGGQAAGTSIREAAYVVNKAGGEVGSTIANMLAGIGTPIGRDIAAAINANVRIPLPNGGSTTNRPNGQLATGNMGRTMPAAGTTGSGAERRTPGGQP